MAKDPTKVADKQINRLKGATQDIIDGVNAVTTAPGIKAAAKKQKWLNNVSAAADKWAGNVSKVPLPEWQESMRNKGIPRISAGLDAARAKIIDFYSQLLPYQDSLKAKIDTMPDTSLDDNINRMAEYARGMAKFSRK